MNSRDFPLLPNLFTQSFTGNFTLWKSPNTLRLRPQETLLCWHYDETRLMLALLLLRLSRLSCYCRWKMHSIDWRWKRVTSKMRNISPARVTQMTFDFPLHRKPHGHKHAAVAPIWHRKGGSLPDNMNICWVQGRLGRARQPFCQSFSTRESQKSWEFALCTAAEIP